MILAYFIIGAIVAIGLRRALGYPIELVVWISVTIAWPVFLVMVFASWLALFLTRKF